MNPSLKDFFNEEKKRVFTPDPYFHTRVMARVRATHTSEAEIWDVVPASTRPVFGLALVLMIAFIALLQTFAPQMPDRGFFEAILEAESSPNDAFLYSGADLPADQELLNRLMGFEEQ
jgi:hypothetical protein